jgi:hypothetical protein
VQDRSGRETQGDDGQHGDAQARRIRMPDPNARSECNASAAKSTGANAPALASFGEKALVPLVRRGEIDHSSGCALHFVGQGAFGR